MFKTHIELFLWKSLLRRQIHRDFNPHALRTVSHASNVIRSRKVEI
jgi:hypothetical protein